MVTERLSPLYVSIHATDPDVRSEMLRNRRGATSLRWLRALLDHGVEVHGQVVVCPGVNDGAVLDDTLVGVLDQYPELATVAVVPLGVSRHGARGDACGPTPSAEAEPSSTASRPGRAASWRSLGPPAGLRRRRVLPAGRPPVPGGRDLRGLPLHEDGIGMARTFEQEFAGEVDTADRRPGPASSPSVDGAPADGLPRARARGQVTLRAPAQRRPVGVLTGTYGAEVLAPLAGRLGRDDVRVLAVENRFFGGNIGVTGLLVGEDLAAGPGRRARGAPLPAARRLPVRWPLPRRHHARGPAPPVEVVATDGLALRAALEPVAA